MPLRALQAPLGDNDKQYRLLMESVTDYSIILLDTQGRVANWNAGAQRMFGYTEEEAVGMPGDRLFTPEDIERGAPREELETAQAAGRASDDRWHVRKDGSRFWVNGTCTALRDADGRLRGFAKVCRDLTEQQQAQEATRHLAAIVADTSDAVLAKTLDGIITAWNAGAEKLYGYSAEEVIGKPVSLIIPPDHADELPAIMERLRRGERVEPFETVRLRKDGSMVPVSVTMSPIRDVAGTVTGASAIARDISERMQLEEALRQADRRKDEFLAMLAHELRNPLAPIRSSLHILQLPQVDAATAQQARDVMERQVHHLVRLVDDLLDVSRIAQGKVRLRKERVELARVIGDAVEACGPLLSARGHQLDVNLASEPVPLEADPTRLAQVIANLLSNAARYTPEGGHIRLSTERVGGEVVLRVIDNGVGIRADFLDRVFELFVQAEPARHEQGGLGLGLALVKGLVELHGGRVEAHSEGPGKGSEFVVRLPIAAGAAREGAAEGAPAGKAPVPVRRVLVVDDHVDAAESLALLLQMEGHQVQTVYHGAGVLEVAAAFWPDVVLLDISMPGGPDGYDLARQLRRLPGLEETLLVAVTGHGQEEDKRRATEAGFDAHLTKPADFQELHALLARGRAS